LTEHFSSVNLRGMNLLNTNQAAERLGISARRVRKLIEAGTLLAQQIGREWAIEDHALQSVRVYGKPGRPSNSARTENRATGQAARSNGTSSRAVGTTSKLNKAFRKATESEDKKGSKK
jgi:excisionase family DNA binding protein